MESQALVNGGSMGTVITRMAMLRAQSLVWSNNV